MVWEDKAMRILVIGAGSTGGYFGGRLAEAGRDVTFLVRPGRAAKLRSEGLQIVSPHGDFTLTPKTLLASEITTPFDLVLLTVKAFALDAAIDDLAPAVGPETMIMPVLNGMRHVDQLVSRFGDRAVIGGVCRVMTTLDPAGRILQLSKMHELVYGERDGRASERTSRLDEVMQGAGFDAKLSRSIEREMWEKWIFLATLGATTCLMRGNIGQIVAHAGAETARTMLHETIAVAVACGHPPSAAVVANAEAQLTAGVSALTSSMYRDLMAGRPVEAEQILGDLLARGRQHGVVTPLLAAAYTQLAIYQSQFSATSL
jgi:2-dehydropantoate 2-reductase